MRKINTLVEFIWNNKLNKYEEIYSESYLYNGELALADYEDDATDPSYDSPPDQPAGSTPWTGTSDYGSKDWHPSYDQMVNWVEQDSLSTGDIAQGFGLDADAGKFFPEPDFWKAGYLADEYGLDEDKYNLAIEKADRAEKEGWESFDTAVDTGLIGADTNMYEIMEGSRAREVQSGMTTGRQGKSRRQTIEKFSAGLEQAQTGAERVGASAEESRTASNIAMSQSKIDLERGEENEKRAWYDDIWDAYSGAVSRGAIEDTSGGKNSTYWVNQIRSGENHWSAAELNEYSNEPDFLEWFSNNLDTMDEYRTAFQGSGTELGNAYNDWKDGKRAGAGGGCVVTTTLNDVGDWNNSQKYTAVKWCKDTHHDGSDRGKTWVRGYHVWGKFLSKIMKKNSIVKYIVKQSTESFMRFEKDKTSLFGALIKYTWINPLSYLIGYVKKKSLILFYITSISLAVMYTILFPIYGMCALIDKLLYKNG